MQSSVDTNVLLRLLLGDIPAHYQAVKKLLAGDTVFLVADAAVIELVFALQRHYGFSRSDTADAVMDILDMPQLQGSAPLFKAVTAHFVSHSALSFEDCYLATYAQQSDAAPLWTFDKKLASQLPDARLLAVDRT
ncbi:MAG TPA: PIN domain-containing protein [Candidatus Saccharimonadales bacterium]|jgi:predicted nucleic acid-binding protein